MKMFIKCLFTLIVCMLFAYIAIEVFEEKWLSFTIGNVCAAINLAIWDL